MNLKQQRARQKKQEQHRRKRRTEARREQYDTNDTRREAISIQYVIDSGWLHTHGMDAEGLPELEMRHVPAFLADAAAGLLRQVCGYMLESGTSIRADETMSTSPRTRFKFVKPEPMPGEEGHYESERLQIVDHEPVCDCCRLEGSERN